MSPPETWSRAPAAPRLAARGRPAQGRLRSCPDRPQSAAGWRGEGAAQRLQPRPCGPSGRPRPAPRAARPRQGRAGRRGGHRALPQRLAMALKFKPLRRRVCEGCRPGLPSKLGRETNLLPANTDARPEQSGRRLRAPEQCVRGEQRLQGTPSVPTPAVGRRDPCPRRSPTPGQACGPLRALAARSEAAEAHAGPRAPGAPRRVLTSWERTEGEARHPRPSRPS